MITEVTVDNVVEEAAAAPYHTILEIWRGVLAPAARERENRVTPQWANRIVSGYQEIRFKDMNLFKDVYFSMVQDLAAILDEEIATDDECLNLTTAEEDCESNAFHYLNILISWQKQFLLWEMFWSTDSQSAAIDIAALAEVHKMFFGEQGILGLLDQIKFEFTDEHKGLLVNILEETRQEVEDAR